MTYLPLDKSPEETFLFYGDTKIYFTAEAEKAFQRLENEHISEKILRCRTAAIACIAFAILATFGVNWVLGGVLGTMAIIPIGIEKGLKARKADFVEQIKRTELPVALIFDKMRIFVDGFWKAKFEYAAERIHDDRRIDEMAFEEMKSTFFTYCHNFDWGIGLSRRPEESKRMAKIAALIKEISVMDPALSTTIPLLGRASFEKLQKSCVRYVGAVSLYRDKSVEFQKEEGRWKVIQLKNFEWDR